MNLVSGFLALFYLGVSSISKKIRLFLADVKSLLKNFHILCEFNAEYVRFFLLIFVFLICVCENFLIFFCICIWMSCLLLVTKNV